MTQEAQVSVRPGVIVSALFARPDGARALFLLGHGAGAGMRHAFLEGLVRRLFARRVATFRYQFPYMERRSKRPDPPPLLLATVEAAAVAAQSAAPDLLLYAGGKSMGGRMTSMAAATGTLGAAVRGLILVGYPLHGPGKGTAAPAHSRRDHLFKVLVPMLFLQGTRDPLSPIEEMREIREGLGGRATLIDFPDADHSFHVPKRSGRSDDAILDELAGAISVWIDAREGAEAARG